MVQNASPRAQKGHFFEHLQWSQIAFGKMRFRPISNLFDVPKRPNFQGILQFSWSTTRHHGLKTGEKHLSKHPRWSRITFRKL